MIKIDDSDDSDIEVQANPFNKGEKENSGSETDKDNQGEEDEEEEDSLDKEAPIKKTIKVDEAFIRKKLSFYIQLLMKINMNDYKEFLVFNMVFLMVKKILMI